MTNFLIVLVTFFIMEFVAWFTHKYIMHGLLWSLHRDHHVKNTKRWFERNDFFFLIFAIPSVILFYFGVQDSLTTPFFIGLGILIYGMCYFLVHDTFIHQRFKFLKQTNNSYLRALRKAHKVHHKSLGKYHGSCFGMLVVPWKYVREARESAKS